MISIKCGYEFLSEQLSADFVRVGEEDELLILLAHVSLEIVLFVLNEQVVELAYTQSLN